MSLNALLKDLPKDEESPLLFHTKLVGKIAVGVGVASAVFLLAMILFVAPSEGEGYGEIISAHVISYKQLGPTLIIAGLLLVAMAAWITWIIALYSTFRIAGPLFRFAKNLETVIEKGPTSVIPIRQGDRLQAESKLLGEGAARLEAHYRTIDKLAERIDALIVKIETQDTPEIRDELKQVMAELRKEEGAVVL